MSKYVLAIDQGTTGTTAMILDADIRVVAKVTQEFAQIYPQPGWVEHDPQAIWQSVTDTVGAVLHESKIKGTQVSAIGITNQRETTLLWDRKTGQPACNAIVWQDRRTADLCAKLKAQGLEDLVRRNTGLVIDPYFSATKLRWMLDEVAGVKGQAEKGQLAFGTIDSYLIYRLTGGASHIIEATNASRTLLMNLRRVSWDQELLQALQIPEAVLPTIKPSSTHYGETQGVPHLPDGIPIAGAAGDQQAALFGQACFAVGDAKCTYGTGAFLLVNTGDQPMTSQNGVLSTLAWQIEDDVTYALEGSAFIAGAAVQWLRDGLGLIDNAAEIESLAQSVPDTGGVVFVPALVGLGAPHWRPNARGTITGITRGTTAAHLARATLEGIALQICELAQAMQQDSGHTFRGFKVDGGAATNDLLMQLQADLLDHQISRPKVIETTALGAAFLAGLATGVWQSTEQIADAWSVDRRFEPQMHAPKRRELLERWSRAVKIA